MKAIRKGVIIYLAMFLFRDISSFSIFLQGKEYHSFLSPATDREAGQLGKKCMKITL